VISFEAGISAPTNIPSHPKCVCASSGEMLVAGTFKPLPIASAMSRTGTLREEAYHGAGGVGGEADVEAIGGALSSLSGPREHSGLVLGEGSLKIFAVLDDGQGQLGRVEHGRVRSFACKGRHEVGRISDERDPGHAGPRMADG
jgi:hypothetical protein